MAEVATSDAPPTTTSSEKRGRSEEGGDSRGDGDRKRSRQEDTNERDGYDRGDREGGGQMEGARDDSLPNRVRRDDHDSGRGYRGDRERHRDRDRHRGGGRGRRDRDGGGENSTQPPVIDPEEAKAQLLSKEQRTIFVEQLTQKTDERDIRRYFKRKAGR